MERVLGAIIAGGRSARFGSDKAVASLNGSSLFDHIFASLSRQVDDIVVCGREWPGLESLGDRPAPGMGPLGGLCAALHHAQTGDYTHVIAAPVDVVPFPGDIVPRLLGTAPRVVAGQHMIGGWPVELAPLLDAHLDAGHRSMRSWIEESGAEYVDCDTALSNINYRSELDEQSRQHGQTMRWTR